MGNTFSTVHGSPARVGVSYGILFWILTYGEVVRLNYRDQISSIPIFTSPLNMGYELMMAKSNKFEPIFYYAMGVWLLLDIIIIYTNCKYEIRDNFKKMLYVSSIIPSYFIQKQISKRLNDYYELSIAWVLDIFISYGYISMIMNRKSLKGQSLFCAYCRFLGNVCMFMFHLTNRNPAFKVYKNKYHKLMYLVVFIGDLIYIKLVNDYNKSMESEK
eukprot:20788_1